MGNTSVLRVPLTRGWHIRMGLFSQNSTFDHVPNSTCHKYGHTQILCWLMFKKNMYMYMHECTSYLHIYIYICIYVFRCIYVHIHIHTSPLLTKRLMAVAIQTPWGNSRASASERTYFCFNGNILVSTTWRRWRARGGAHGLHRGNR